MRHNFIFQMACLVIISLLDELCLQPCVNDHMFPSKGQGNGDCRNVDPSCCWTGLKGMWYSVHISSVSGENPWPRIKAFSLQPSSTLSLGHQIPSLLPKNRAVSQVLSLSDAQHNEFVPSKPPAPIFQNLQYTKRETFVQISRILIAPVNRHCLLIFPLQWLLDNLFSHLFLKTAQEIS